MARDYEPFSAAIPADAAIALQAYPELSSDPRYNLGVTRLKLRKSYSGDYVASSSGGSDLILDRDVFFTNRAGNEFRLRDSDQTSILQARNEFVANAAGYYRRGLIKRNAFAFLPDLYPLGPNNQPVTTVNAAGATVVVIAPGVSSTLNAVGDPIDRNPAYDTLLGFGLINTDGTLNFLDQITPAGYYINPENSAGTASSLPQINVPATTTLLSSAAPSTPVLMPADTNTLTFYPPVVMPDGQHVSYITHGEPSANFANSLLAYTEDRFEMQHLSDGTMAVTEEGDGFQIDPVAPVYIEDVKGTYVGNDFYTDSGRPLYKRVLGMRLFASPDQNTPSAGPAFEPIDPVQRLGLFDALGLARVFRMQSPYPGSSNQYVFGLTKEGKVLCHIPKTQAGEPHEKGKSVDLNVLGLIKAIVGSDENNSNTSIDLRTTGGINLDIGRFTGGTNSGASIVLNLQGGIVKNHNADPNSGVASDERYLGSMFEAGSATKLVTWDGNVIHNAGGELGNSGHKITNNAGPGGQADICSGDKGTTVLGKTQEQFGQLVFSIYVLGKSRITISGVDSHTIFAGGFARTVLGGTGMSDTVVAGNMTKIVGTGNLLQSVATGNFSVTVGAGNLSLASPSGPISITSTLATSITSGILTSIVSPVTKIGLATSFAVAGIPGPPGPMLDFITGLPLFGIPTIAIG